MFIIKFKRVAVDKVKGKDITLLQYLTLKNAGSSYKRLSES